MDFSDALKSCRNGAKISRSAWGGKRGGTFVVYCTGYPEGVPANKNASEALGIPEGEILYPDPYFMISDAKRHQTPWLPTQKDLLAEDWWVFS